MCVEGCVCVCVCVFRGVCVPLDAWREIERGNMDTVMAGERVKKRVRLLGLGA